MSAPPWVRPGCFEGPVDSVGDALGADLLAVLREALSNVARHARATSAGVTVTVGDDLALRVEDNGIAQPPDGHRRRVSVLRTMTARAAKLGGTCDRSPAGPSGTTLHWRVPLP
jgi:signal transduction histidine kinase